jgi:hypothetical protein
LYVASLTDELATIHSQQLTAGDFKRRPGVLNVIDCITDRLEKLQILIGNPDPGA